MQVDPSVIAEHLPGEPRGEGVRGPRLGWRILQRVLVIAVMFLVLAPLWLVYVLGLLVTGRPPKVPRAARVGRYLRRAFTESPPAPGLSAGQRVWLALAVVRKVVFVPRQHPPRRRHDYQLDRSLAQCGIDVAAIEAALADYRAWCRGTRADPSRP